MLNSLHSVDGQMLPKWFIRIWPRASRTRSVCRNPRGLRPKIIRRFSRWLCEEELGRDFRPSVGGNRAGNVVHRDSSMLRERSGRGVEAATRTLRSTTVPVLPSAGCGSSSSRQAIGR